MLIWNEHGRRGKRVLAACPQARGVGVRVGMPIAQASQLCVAQVLPHDPAADLRALQRLAENFHDRVTPLVSIETVDKTPWAGHPRHQSESLVCDVGGVAHLFGGEAGLLAFVTDMLEQQGLAARMAIADHEAAAWAVAHGMTQTARAWIARHAGPAIDKPVPPRCTVVPPNQTEIFIQPLCVTTLRINESTRNTLDRLGIQTVGQLLKLPRGGLAARLGTVLIDRIAALLGQIQMPLNLYKVPVEYHETWTLEYPTADQNILLDRITRLTKRIRAGLTAQKRGALRIKCCLDLSAHPPLTLQVGLFAPTTDVDHLCDLLSTKLQGYRLRGDVHRISLSVTLSGPIRSMQISLLDQPAGGQSLACPSMSGSSIARLVDSLSNRLGRDQVVKVRPTKQPLPEAAFQTIFLTGSTAARAAAFGSGANRRRGTNGRRSRKVSETLVSQPPGFGHHAGSHPAPGDALRRPMSLLASPLPLKVAFDDGAFCKWVSRTDLPDRLLVHNVAYRIVRFWGPERIETGWWRGPSVRRDYFRVQVSDATTTKTSAERHRWWWIYRDFSCGTEQTQRCRWVLHGRFA